MIGLSWHRESRGSGGRATVFYNGQSETAAARFGILLSVVVTRRMSTGTPSG